MEVRLTELIGEPFYPVHCDIKEQGHSFYDLYGGRGSTKSSFVSIEIVLGMMKDPDANAVVFRKVFGTCRESVFAQIGWAIDALEVSDQWKESVTPLKYTYLPTGQVILFKGLDKARKTKSIKCSKGYFKYLWFEELDEFDGPEEIRMAQQSILRGGPVFQIFKTFNPPISVSNWANRYVLEPDPRAYRHSSDYRSIPEEWLGEEFIAEAEHLMETDEKAYRHEYLGEPVGIGTTIFDNLEVREITDEEIASFERIYQGQDWGWYPDPKAFVRLSYNHQQECIYIFDEAGGCKIRNSDMAAEIKRRGYDDYEIICGADEIESIEDFRDAGLPARKVDNRPGSVRYGMEWLQTRNKIIVDPSRTPHAYKELIEYEHDRDRNGEVIANYPDKNNHYIDAMRYAVSPMSLYRGASA